MATKSIAWNDGSGDYITLTYTGQGNGTITASSPVNNGAARSKIITIKTANGAVTRNLTVNQQACPVPIGSVLNYDYTGSYQEVELPAGQYKLQFWGAQGGSNAAASSYGITAKAGGKGGYSEGVLTLTSKTTVRVYVGGQGSSSAGGFNGGGSTTGTSQYNSGGEFGISKMGGGGGASDLRLSDGALLSRMIVAGGGGGGAMCYKFATTTNTTNVWPSNSTSTKNIWPSSGWVNGTITGSGQDSSATNRCRSEFIATDDATSFNVTVNSGWKIEIDFYIIDDNDNPVWESATGWLSSSTTVSPTGRGHGYVKFLFAKTDNSNVSPSQYSSVGSVSVTYSQNWTNKNITNSGYERYNGIRALTKNYIDINGATSISISANSGWLIEIDYYTSGQSWISDTGWQSSGTYTPPSNARYIKILYKANPEASINLSNSSSVGSVSKTITSTTTSTDSQVGGVGGGIEGGSTANNCKGKQNAAGNEGGFGYGANEDATNYRYASGAGGGGWYGGGRLRSDSEQTYVKHSGGGSGFVNTAASAGNRPSGYNGLQLDSGETKDGSQTFKAPGGSNETGHAGNGYARITRLS